MGNVWGLEAARPGGSINSLDDERPGRLRACNEIAQILCGKFHLHASPQRGKVMTNLLQEFVIITNSGTASEFH